MSKEILSCEINEQPEVIERLLDLERSNIKLILSGLREKFDNIVIAARGTSDNAALYAKYLFGSKNEIPVALAAPSLFTTYQKPPQMKRALVLAISQSGQSPDVISVVREAHKQGRPTLAITNNPESPLASISDFSIDIRAGHEEAVAATKSYTASL